MFSSFKINRYKVQNINDKINVDNITKLKPDVIIESGWSQIISRDIIDIPKYGTIGLHYSMLPKNQGGASLNWALIRDEKEWG